ncbi:START domain-containing protein 10 [Halyomorpha halys]|uniref:START domain-containing protein 10 n=1 Tax=Halyomorpha halys TaxID=286706 RepID=UPI0006D50C89|nr:START domain-containing protein 10-like [Halyomorpha halys]
MEVGAVRVAEDSDFSSLKDLLDCHTDWKLDYNKGPIKVWTKGLHNTNFKMIKVLANFPEISPEIMYDVLHDPEYRKIWDQHMIESHDIGILNPNNDVGYYSMSCPSPLANRDFVLQRSWLDLGIEKYILNHSVYHINYPPKKGFIRATSYLTGFLVRETEGGGCNLGYISQTDPRGTLPPWLVNKVTQIFGPKMVKSLQKATLGYNEWKSINNPNWKPWHFPEQMRAPRLDINECVMSAAEKKYKYNEEEDSKIGTPSPSRGRKSLKLFKSSKT